MRNSKLISLHPLTEFVYATSSKKKRIIREQKKANLFTAPLYRTVKSVLPKFFIKNFDKEILIDAIERLQRGDQSTTWKRNNVENSILALRHFIAMNFPKEFEKIRCQFFTKLACKECFLNGVVVRVAPDVVFRWGTNGQKFIGGIRFHIGKTKPLANNVARLRASMLSYYLREIIAEDDEIVNNEFCFCVDIIHENIVIAPKDISLDITLLNRACREIIDLWDVA